MVAIPLERRNAEVISKVFIHRIMHIFGPTKFLVAEKDMAFTAKVIQYILE